MKDNYRKPSDIALWLSLLLVCTFVPDVAGAGPFTLEQVLSAPFPSDLVSSPSGDKVAWIFNDQGRRNVWLAEGPAYHARKITNYDADDGMTLSGLGFDSGGDIVVFVRGDPKNKLAEYANPTSTPRRYKQTVWAVRTSGGEPWSLGEGSSPKVSPKRQMVVFVLNNKILKAPIDGSEKCIPLLEPRGAVRSMVWSPDGRRLAFVSNREDHSFIGVYNLDSDTITWMAPSVDRDESPVWSPDGERIAFIRFPGAKGDDRRMPERDLPFTIWVANAETGDGKAVWSCPDSSGGFAQSYPRHPLMWAAGERLVFYSEHSGWMQLYALSMKDGRETCLTPGEFEVEESCLSHDTTRVIFSSNKGDIDRRHLWSVTAGGGDLVCLTKGKGIEWGPVVSANGRDLYFLCSTASQPAAPAVMNVTGGGRRLITPGAIPDEFPRDWLVEPVQVLFDAADGLRIHGQLFIPKEVKAGERLPAVIFMHGGPIRQMLLGWHMRGYYHNSYAMNQYLADKGYVVLSVNFRCGIGYGRSFRKAANQGPRGAAEYQDILAAARFLRDRPEVDPGRIGLWGGSYGGYLTALGLARDSALFAAGVDFHGVHDWALRSRRRDGDWGIRGDEDVRLAYDSSPVADVSFWSSPVLFIHGDDDRNVDFIQTTDLVQRLRAEGKARVETLVFPDEVHGFLRHDSWIRAFRATEEFFNRFLKSQDDASGD